MFFKKRPPAAALTIPVKTARGEFNEGNILQFLGDKNIVTIFCRNNYDGLGDAKHAVDIFNECQRIYADSGTQLKLVILMEEKKVEIVKIFLPTDVNYVVSSLEDRNHFDAQADVIIFSTKNSGNIETCTEPFLGKIRNHNEFFSYWCSTNLFINVSLQLADNDALYSDLNPTCFRYSINEYGPAATVRGKGGFARPPFLEDELGVLPFEAGIKFDEDIWKLANQSPQEKFKLLLNLENDQLKNSLLNSVYDKGIDSADLLIGYAQNAENVARLLELASHTCEKQKRAVVFPLKFLTDNMIEDCKKYFSVISLINDDQVKVLNQELNNSKELYLFNYMGQSENDLKILYANAVIIMSSGDNSLSAAFSNPYSMPFFQIPLWKIRLYLKLITELGGNSEGPKYENMRNYLLLGADAPYEEWGDLQAEVHIEDEDEFPPQSDEEEDVSNEEEGPINENQLKKLNQLWRDQIIYFKKNKQQLYEEWRELANEWHTAKNYYKQLQKLIYTAAIQKYISVCLQKGVNASQAMCAFIESANKSKNSHYQHYLVYACILNNDIATLKKLLKEIDVLQPVCNQASLTTIALILERSEVADLLITKDLDFYAKILDLVLLPQNELNRMEPFFQKHHINIHPAKILRAYKEAEKNKNKDEQEKQLNLLSNNVDSLFIKLDFLWRIMWEIAPGIIVLIVAESNSDETLLNDADFQFYINGQFVLLKSETPCWIKQELTTNNQKIFWGHYQELLQKAAPYDSPQLQLCVH